MLHFVIQYADNIGTINLTDHRQVLLWFNKKYPAEQWMRWDLSSTSQTSSAETTKECSVAVTGNKLPHPEIKP